MSLKNPLSLTTIALLLFFASCWSDKGKNIPDVSNIKVDVEVADFHQKLFSIDTNDIEPGIIQLKEEFPTFFEIYFLQIAGIAKNSTVDDNLLDNAKHFLTAPYLRHLSDTIKIVHGDFKKYEKDFEKAFQFFKYYFPNRPVPIIYPCYSTFDYGAFNFLTTKNEDALGIGLELYLGKDYPYWRVEPGNPAFSNYLTRTWTPEHLVKKSMDAIANDLVPMTDGDRLLDLMIYNGKKMYIIDQFLPYTPDSIKWEYTTTQTDWVKSNEEQIWRHFLENELLYETRINKIKKLVDQSPSSPGMPPEAPGRTANFMGMRIIQSFMKQKPNFTMEQLIALDAQKIFNQANYKPRNL